MDKPAPAMASVQFALPVDSENKATELRVWSFARPHMSSFHVNWMAFFCTFVSTFAPAALIPAVRDSLDLNKEDIGNAGIAAVTGTIVTRVVMGSLCDLLGPRICMVAMLLLSSAPIFGMALATSPLDFIMCRFGIGFGLGSFVACQYWTSSMFNVKIVGMANATAAGWGNLGGGVTQLLLPLVYAAISSSVASYTAWRWAFYVPGCMHLALGWLCLFVGQDAPEGNYAALKETGAMKKDSSLKKFIIAITNYRMFILMILYGTCFGIELTMNNIITAYLFDQFELDLTVAGVVGSCFGLMNLFARSLGGWLSDKLAVKSGMRGRIWALFITIFLEGVFCIAMGFSSTSLAASIAFMIIFSSFVQAAEGATFAIVPFVSKRALGVVSGFCGAGGNLGAVMAQYLFFTKESMATYDGIKYMGYMVTASAFLAILIWFPMWGSMFTSAREGVTEEDYYLGEYTEEERAAGLADAAMRFAAESKSQRGIKVDLEKVEGQ